MRKASEARGARNIKGGHDIDDDEEKKNSDQKKGRGMTG